MPSIKYTHHQSVSTFRRCWRPLCVVVGRYSPFVRTMLGFPPRAVRYPSQRPALTNKDGLALCNVAFSLSTSDSSTGMVLVRATAWGCRSSFQTSFPSVSPCCLRAHAPVTTRCRALMLSRTLKSLNSVSQLALHAPLLAHTTEKLAMHTCIWSSMCREIVFKMPSAPWGSFLHHSVKHF